MATAAAADNDAMRCDTMPIWKIAGNNERKKWGRKQANKKWIELKKLEFELKLISIRQGIINSVLFCSIVL